jgi:hypothetical protein
MRNLIRLTLLAAASATLFACKPKQEAPPPVAAAPEESVSAEQAAAAAFRDQKDACVLKMTAPESADWTTYWTPTGGPSQVHSVHWGNAQEKEGAAKSLMANPLQISCSSNDSGGISVSLTAPTATEADIPMAPGTYPIFGRMQPPVKGAQIVASSLTYDGRNFDSRKGTLTLSRFDSEGVEGSFTIDGVETNEGAAPIHLEGTFEIPCIAAQMESECAAD